MTELTLTPVVEPWVGKRGGPFANVRGKWVVKLKLDPASSSYWSGMIDQDGRALSYIDWCAMFDTEAEAEVALAKYLLRNQ